MEGTGQAGGDMTTRLGEKDSGDETKKNVQPSGDIDPAVHPTGDKTNTDQRDRDIEDKIDEDIEVVSDKDEDYMYSDDFEELESGDETDIEDNDVPNGEIILHRIRDPNPLLPETVTCLDTEWGSKVYLVGTAHFSEESQRDVMQTIHNTQPDVVMVELCNSRINILQLDEATLLEEAQNINMEKIRLSIKQSGVVQGIMHLLFLSMSAHLTKELGMAPGGEFRAAFREARRIPGCRLQLGDRPINITLRRALSSLSVWQKLRLAWYLITSKDPISKEDVEKCKQKDLLEEMLKEMTGEFPALSKVFVQERDTFLANSLKLASQPIEHPDAPNGYIPTVVVGVVGIGHVPGIVLNWKNQQYDIKDIMMIPEGSWLGSVFRLGVKLSLLGLLSFACFKMYRWTLPMIT